MSTNTSRPNSYQQLLDIVGSLVSKICAVLGVIMMSGGGLTCLVHTEKPCEQGNSEVTKISLPHVTSKIDANTQPCWADSDNTY